MTRQGIKSSFVFADLAEESIHQSLRDGKRQKDTAWLVANFEVAGAAGTFAYCNVKRIAVDWITQ